MQSRESLWFFPTLRDVPRGKSSSWRSRSCDSYRTARVQKVASGHTVTTWHRKDCGPRGPVSDCSPSQEDPSPSDHFTSLRGTTNLRRRPLSRTRPSIGAFLPYQQLQLHRQSLLPLPFLAFFTKPLSLLPRLQNVMSSIVWFRTSLVYCRVCPEFWPQEDSISTVWSSAVPRWRT